MIVDLWGPPKFWRTQTVDLVGVPDLTAGNGPVLEKAEGLMVTANGNAFIVTVNDGVDDSSGETQLIHLGSIFT